MDRRAAVAGARPGEGRSRRRASSPSTAIDTIERSLSGAVKYYGTIDLIDARHPQTILAYGLNGKAAAGGKRRAAARAGRAPARLQDAEIHRQRIELIDSFAAMGLGKGGYWEDRGYDWFGGTLGRTLRRRAVHYFPFRSMTCPFILIAGLSLGGAWTILAASLPDAGDAPIRQNTGGISRVRHCEHFRTEARSRHIRRTPAARPRSLRIERQGPGLAAGRHDQDRSGLGERPRPAQFPPDGQLSPAC